MWGGFISVLDSMRRCPNIHVDISWLHVRRYIPLLVRELGPERVFFGTGCRTHYGAAIAALVHAEVTDEERQQIRWEHHVRMQERAKERGMTLPNEPPMFEMRQQRRQGSTGQGRPRMQGGGGRRGG